MPESIDPPGSVRPLGDGVARVSDSLRIRALHLRNRLAFRAHVTHLAEEVEAGPATIVNRPLARMTGYYAARAQGGAAMIIVEAVPVHRSTFRWRSSLDPRDTGLIASLQTLTEACHRHDARIVLQLEHAGAGGDSDHSGAANWSPSGGPSYRSFHGSHAMTPAQIAEVIAGFSETASLAVAAGFDGVEVDAGPGSLIEQFWSPVMNERADAWSSDVAHRNGFCLAVLEGVREAIGPDRLLGVQVSGRDSRGLGLPLAERLSIVEELDRQGLVDLWHVTSGDMLDIPAAMPTFHHPETPALQFSAALKASRCNAIVMVSGGFLTPESAAAAVAERTTDLVGCVRAMVADAEFARKLVSDDVDSIRPCIGCTEKCLGRAAREYRIACAVNPAAGRESDGLQTTASSQRTVRRVLVIGGGPGGLEAARQTALLGHRVTLRERSPQLGGQLALLAIQPKRHAVRRLIRWYERELSRLDVDIRLDDEAMSTQLQDGSYDMIVVATGADAGRRGLQRLAPDKDELPGFDRTNSLSVHDVLSGDRACGRRVLILDDCHDWSSIGTALYLAERGHEVTMSVGHSAIGKHIAAGGALGLVRRRFKELGLRELPDTLVVEWHGDRAVLLDRHSGQTRDAAFDTLVIANTGVARNTLLDELRGCSLTVAGVGDCVAPRDISAAILEGRRLAMEI